MRNINKELLIKEYIENNNIKNEDNYYDYEEVVCHKIGKYKLNEFIQDFLKDYLFNNKNGEFVYISLEELINDIEEFDVSQVASWEIDIFYNKLMCSYEVFSAWLDINERNEYSIVETIKEAQFNAYYELYNFIKNDAISFLKRK